jgi:hypothetical protein
MPTEPRGPENSSQKNLVESRSFSSARGDGEQAKRTRRETFDRQERLELAQSRRMLLGQSLPWAAFGAIVFALIAWGIESTLGFASNWVGPGWAPPGALLSLVLGALCGALGGACAGVLYHSLSDEDSDLPFVVMGVATVIAVVGAVYGAGQGGVLQTALGIGVGLTVGVITGLGVYILYWGLKRAYFWVRKEFNGH